MKTEYLQYDIERGWKWYHQHKNYVDSLVNGTKHSYPMSGSDISHPELWKPAAWRWFLDKYASVTA